MTNVAEFELSTTSRDSVSRWLSVFTLLFFAYVVAVTVIKVNAVTYGLALALTPVAFYFALGVSGQRGLAGMPWAVVFVLFWIFLSALWSPTPQTTLIKALVCAAVVCTIYWSVTAIGVAQIVARLGLILFLCLAFQYAMVFFSATGVHSENQSFLRGAWRGAFAHKNEAGAFVGATMIWFAWAFGVRRSWFNLAGLVLAAVFLYNSNSVSSILLTALGLSMLFIAPSPRNSRLAKPLKVLLLIVVAVVGLIFLFDPVVQSRIFDDPLALTGRVGLWKAAYGFWLENPVIGGGFRSVFSNNFVDLTAYAETAYTFLAPHPHNAYLDLLAGTGLIGFSAAVFAFVLTPLVLVIRIPTLGFSDPMTACFGIFVFLSVRALLEGSILQFDNAGWFLFALVTALIFKNSQDISRKV